MLAVQDFAAGAMENWGLITYRETALLYKSGVSALTNKERVATVVSHELAHQWFGNSSIRALTLPKHSYLIPWNRSVNNVVTQLTFKAYY